MIHLKTVEEIEIMKIGGKKLQDVTKVLIPQIKAGMTTMDIDREAVRLILKEGGEISFNKVPGYSWSTCLPINEQVVHTPPSDRVLKDGDVLTVDIGIFYKGFHVDWATSIIIGEPQNKEHVHFLEVGKKALSLGIEKVQPGGYLGDISQAIQKEIYGNGFFILKELTGHGVGRELHEEPFIPGILEKPVEKTRRIKPGMVLAIEVIYSMGSEEIAYEKGDDWSILTSDGSISACFEETVAVTEQNSFILT